MKILCLESINDKNLTALGIKAEFNCEVYEVSSIEQAKKHLVDNRDTTVVIVNQGAFHGAGSEIFSLIKAEKLKSAVLIIDKRVKNFDELKELEDFFEYNPYNQFFSSEEGITDLIDAISALLPHDDRLKRNYARISLDKVKDIRDAPFDVYIRLSQDKFVKIFNKGEIYSDPQIEKYRAKGVKELFVKMGEYLLWTGKASIDLQQSLNQIKSSSTDALTRVKVHTEIIGKINENIQNFGISDLIVGQVAQVTESMSALVKDSDELLNLVTTMMKGSSYITEHSLLLSYFSGTIAHEMEWVTENTTQKLAMAAIFHDSLFTNESLAKIMTTKDDDFKRLPWKEVVLVRKHPSLIAEMIAKAKGIPHDVDTIVATHHERPDGSGFPRGLTAARIHPLSAVFNITEDFVTHLYHIKHNKEQLDELIEQFGRVYNHGNYKKPYDALCKMIKKSRLYK